MSKSEEHSEKIKIGTSSSSFKEFIMLPLRMLRESCKLIMRLPCRAKVILVLAMTLSVMLYGSLLHSISKNHLKEDTFLQIDKCPACFGTNFCSRLHNGAVRFNGWSRVRLLDAVNVKNVYFGTYQGQPVVLKKLGHNKELRELDQLVCLSANMRKNCDVSRGIYKSKLAIKNSPSSLIPDDVRELSDLTHCPSHRLLDRILAKYQEKMGEEQRDLIAEELMFLMSTLIVNPEPLILQTFPAHEGWPFPRYIGACGRFVLVEYAGDPLSNYYSASWEKRVDLAYQLFQVADNFTNNDLQFALYHTDLGYDNIVVSPQGRVVIVDAENVIVVDKQLVEQEKPSRWDEPLVSKFDKCKASDFGQCVSFSPKDLCTRVDADHNYYSICRNLLSKYGTDEGKPGGFLHDMPKTAKDLELDILLDECAKPVMPNGRLEVKDKLLAVLRRLVHMNNAPQFQVIEDREPVKLPAVQELPPADN